MSKLSIDLPQITETQRHFHPENYILDENLQGAVSVAIALNQPLLITGEPGTGKTRLAHKIAWDLSQSHPEFSPEPLIFNTKTTSVAQDMFYIYDALRHFHDANIKKNQMAEAPPTSDYIELRAFGKALALSNPEELQKGRFIHENMSKSSVVLIDEIDKAPRDFPNDILNEIENMEFEIKEAGNYKIKKGPDHRIVVIMTSNSEKNLPEPFLRRCVFYHIPFPEKEQLLQIVESQLGERNDYADEKLIEHFEMIRSVIKKKKPATAELFAWLRILELHHFLDENVNFNLLNSRQKKVLKMSYSVLAKDKNDLKNIETNFLK